MGLLSPLPSLYNPTPLIVFINPRSGGLYGKQLITQFQKLLDLDQVFNLDEDKGPRRG